MPAVPQAASILASLGQAAFVWDVTAGSIAWSDNAGAVFTDIPPETLASATEFARLIEPARSIRSDALEQSRPARSGEGVTYRIEYGVRTSTSAPVIWIEETGCWFAGPDGKPARVTIDRRGMDGGAVTGGAGGGVSVCAGPWRTSGQWWRKSESDGWDRDEWDVTLTDGATYRLFRARDTERWFVDGVVD